MSKSLDNQDVRYYSIEACVRIHGYFNNIIWYEDLR